MNSTNHPDWAHTEEALKRSMGKEIDLMREILSNMLLEENSLVEQDKSSWVGLMQNRFYLIEQVKVFRQDRMNATQKLLSLSDEKTFETLLLDGKDISCEIVCLLDQLIALSEKINFQNRRNESLSNGPQHFIAIPHFHGHPHHLQAFPAVKSRKNFLMTIP